MAKDRVTREPSKSPLEKLRAYIHTTMAAYPNPDRKDKSNAGRMLHEIWIWQECASLAASAEKAAWQAAQLGDHSLIPPDAELREDTGESIVADSDSYSCLVRVDAPRATFDKETFIAIVSREYKIPAAELLRVVERSTKEGTAPLTKRVVPAEPR